MTIGLLDRKKCVWYLDWFVLAVYDTIYITLDCNYYIADIFLIKKSHFINFFSETYFSLCYTPKVPGLSWAPFHLKTFIIFKHNGIERHSRMRKYWLINISIGDFITKLEEFVCQPKVLLSCAKVKNDPLRNFKSNRKRCERLNIEYVQAV